jgi:hypothetical protein
MPLRGLCPSQCGRVTARGAGTACGRAALRAGPMHIASHNARRRHDSRGVDPHRRPRRLPLDPLFMPPQVPSQRRVQGQAHPHIPNRRCLGGL